MGGRNIPSRRTLEENGTKGLEEERRLAYVGLTRACKHAIISTVANRMVYGSWTNAIPSRFIAELPPEHIESQLEAGMFGTMNRGSFGGHSGSHRFSGTSAKPSHVYDEFETASPSSYASPFGKTQYPPRPKPAIAKTAFIEGRAERVTSSVAKYRKGERVFHQKFGYGVIQLCDGDKLEVEFEHAGIKKIMADFVVPASQAGSV